MNSGLKVVVAVVLSAIWVASAYALPRDPSRLGGTDGRIVVPPVDCQAVNVSFNASASEIQLGGTAVLTWSAQLSPSCPASQLILNGTGVGLTGQMSVKPMSNTLYVLQVPGVATLGSLSINVQLPNTVDINGGSAEWAALLVQA